LGQALTQQGHAKEAVDELERAVAIADRLGSPLVRWETRAALATAQRAAGEDPEAMLAGSTTIIREVAASLSPERADTYLAAPAVQAVLDGQ
jgi:hypothetical protein